MRNAGNSKKVKLLKRLMAFILCFSLVVPGMIASASEIDELRARREQLQEDKNALQTQLDNLQGKEDSIVSEQEVLAKKISVVENEINETIKSIEFLSGSIDTLETKLEKSKDEMGETFDLFKQRVRALYKSGTVGSLGTLEILMNSSNLHDFSMRTETIKGITEHDQKIIDQIKNYMMRTENERTECENQKKELAEAKKSLETNQSDLANMQEQNNALLVEIKDEKGVTIARKSENEEESADLLNKMEALIAQKAREEAEEKARLEKAAAEAAEAQAANNNSNADNYTDTSSGDSGSSDSGSSDSGSSDSGNSNSGNSNSGSTTAPSTTSPTSNPNSGEFSPTWPIPGVYYITQHYGNNGHNGMDIAGAYGTPIVAAESGQVIVANNYDSWGDSWGYYVLIYHNGTYTTRYAHLSSLSVSNGQYVSKGQTIGYEGSTGNSTGPHLHFEVYQNGSRINPYQFF